MFLYNIFKNNYFNIILISLLLSIITVGIYLPVRNHDFINYDDYEYVVENKYVNKGFSIDGARWAFFAFHMSNWHPITWLSHMLDCHLFGLDPGKHHLTNVAIHILNTILLFFILYRSTGILLPGFFVSAFFSVHPMHVESVAWIAERKDLLSTFFMFLTFISYIEWVKTQKKWKYWTAVLFFVLGLMSKPMIVTLPCLLLLFDYWPLQRFSIKNIKTDLASIAGIIAEKIPFFILTGISGLITVLSQKKGGAIASMAIYPISVRLHNASVSYFEYIKKLFYPVNLALPYPHPGSKTDLMILIVSVLFILMTSIFVIMMINKKKYLCVGWFWYIGTLIPVIGIIQVGEQAMADRYTYIPYVGLFIMILWVCYDLLNKKIWQKTIYISLFSAALIASGILTGLHIKNWPNSFTLFEHALRVTSNNYVAHSNLGFSILANKNLPLEKAAEHFQEAIRIKPGFAIAHLNLGVCLSAIGQDQKAFESFSRAIRFKPDYVDAYYNIGNYYLKKANYPEALNYYSKATQINPAFGNAYNGLGFVYAHTGDTDKAISCFGKAILLNPENSIAKKNYIILTKIKNEKNVSNNSNRNDLNN